MRSFSYSGVTPAVTRITETATRHHQETGFGLEQLGLFDIV
jgi:hypothetical protein